MLTLPEPERELWERFVSRGRVLASHPVLTRWKRALSLGVAADVVAKPSGLDGARLRERRERCDTLLEEGLPIVDPMASEPIALHAMGTDRRAADNSPSSLGARSRSTATSSSPTTSTSQHSAASMDARERNNPCGLL